MTTVTVGCRVPNGLQLRLGGQLVQIHGPNHPQMHEVDPATGRKREAPWRVSYRFGFTPGVDAAAWDEWARANADSDLVRSGMVWASADPEGEAVRRARGAPSGLEQGQIGTVRGAGVGQPSQDGGVGLRRGSSFSS